MTQSEYCNKYFIPEDYLWEILEDSKVVPMIRGKASEYSAYLFLKDHLDKHVFTVDKLNLNAQPGSVDEDVSITYRPTGLRLKVEVKNAARGEFKDGKRTKKAHGFPHFTVKCHKSRSNIKKAKTTNDRYLLGEFDLIMSNVLNSIYASATYESEFSFIKEKNIELLKRHYHVSSDRELEIAAANDWRFVFPEDIAEDCKGMRAIPRFPCVLLENDPNWFKIEELPTRLEMKAVEITRALKKSRR